MKGRKREADYLRTSISEERHIREFCVFSFCPTYPDLEVSEEADNSESASGCEEQQKAPTNTCSLSSQQTKTGASW